jgi:outer membrane protein OmpA-like peptidoglycan-associated protein
MIIEIVGPTDNVGDDNLNLSLSQKCTDAVRAYFLVNYFNLHP